MAATEENLRKRGGMGSGNMSTPSTTVSNASSSGYGYSALYEALAQMAGYSDSATAMAAAAVATDTSSGGTVEPSTYTDPYSDAALANLSLAEQQALLQSLEPTKLLGVNLEEAGIGTAVSTLTNLLAPTPFGILGMAAAKLAKSAYAESQFQKQLQVSSYLKGTNPSAGDTPDDPTGGITAVTEEATKAIPRTPYTGPKVEDTPEPTETPSSPLDTWLRENVPIGSNRSNSDYTPSEGPNTGVGSGFNSANWGNYGGNSNSDSDSSTSSSSDGGDS